VNCRSPLSLQCLARTFKRPGALIAGKCQRAEMRRFHPVDDVLCRLEARSSDDHRQAFGYRGSSGPYLMVRRSLAIAVVSLALSSAVALAFAPSGKRAGRAWGRELLGAAFGYTPTGPDIRSGFATGAEAQEPTESPGAFCPVRPPRGQAEDGSLAPPLLEAPLLSAPASTPAGDSVSLLLPPPSAVCPGSDDAALTPTVSRP
jgi:hypothetical protein